MYKTLVVLVLITISTFAKADDFNMLPFSGLKYFEKGLTFEKLELELDDKTWTSNRFGPGSQFKLSAKNIVGFKADEEGNFHPNISVLILDSKGDTVGYASKFMGEQSIMEPNYNNDLSVNLGFKEGTVFGDYVFLMVFYDELSDNRLETELKVVYTATPPKYNTTANLYNHSSNTRYLLQSPSAAVGDFIPSKQKVSDGFEYQFQIKGYLLGFSAFLKQPDYLLEVFDATGKLINATKYTAKVDYSEEELGVSAVNITISFLNEIEDPNYTTRFRWESRTGMFILDFVNQFKDL